MVHGSSEVAKEHGQVLLKTKVFARDVRKVANEYLYLSTSFKAGFVKSVTGRPLKVNDAFYLHNFKGIRNLGYFYDREGKKRGLCGDILGFDRFASLQVKVAQVACPLLSNWNLEPFLFTNLALTPNRGAAKEDSSFLAKYLRCSAGFGLALHANTFALEGYYSVFVHGKKNELAADFQINLGLD